MKYSRLLKADQQKISYFFSTTGLGELFEGSFEALRMQDPNRFEYFLNMLPLYMDTHEFNYIPVPYKYGVTIEDEVRELAEIPGSNQSAWQEIAQRLGIEYLPQNQDLFHDFIQFFPY